MSVRSAGRGRAAALLACSLALTLAASCQPGTDRATPGGRGGAHDGAVVVASFNFPESELLAAIYGLALRHAGIPVQLRLGLGPRELVQPALEQGLVGVVPEYLGTALSSLGSSRGVPMSEKMFLRKEGITAVTGVAMDEVTGDQVRLSDGTRLPFRYAMVVPPFVGQDIIRATPGLSDDKGYVPVQDTYQSKAYPEIYAVGIAAQVTVPWQTAVPIGIPKTGLPVESMAKVAARNIAAAVRGEPLASHKEFGEMAAVCMMDAGNNGVLILADHMLPPRKAGVMIPGPQVHAMKLAFEKYYLWKSRHGYVRLP